MSKLRHQSVLLFALNPQLPGPVIPNLETSSSRSSSPTRFTRLRHRRAGPAVGRLARSERPARHGTERQVHGVAARQPEIGLVRGRLLAGGRYVSFSGEALSDLLRSTEFSIVANNLFDKGYLSAITENAAWLGAPRTISMTATVSF